MKPKGLSTFYASLAEQAPDDPTREQLDAIATKALRQLCLSLGIDVSGDRIAAILLALRGRYTPEGRRLNIGGVLRACSTLEVDADFREAVRFHTLTPGDILTAVDKSYQVKSVDPVVSTRRRELQPSSRQLQLPVGDRD